jgi:hypothetical protein
VNSKVDAAQVTTKAGRQLRRTIGSVPRVMPGVSATQKTLWNAKVAPMESISLDQAHAHALRTHSVPQVIARLSRPTRRTIGSAHHALLENIVI